MQETELDTSVFSTFEDEADENFAPVSTKEKKQKVKKKKSFFKFLKKKNKDKNNSDEIIQEDAFEKDIDKGKVNIR